MALIKIKGRADSIIVDYQTAKRVKQRKFGDTTVQPAVGKASPNDLCDLGDTWCGEYSRIVEIELNDKPRAPQLEERLSPLTPEELIEHRKFMDKMRKDLEDRGIIKKHSLNKSAKSKMTLTRSGLNEYKEKFGIEYKIPEGTQIIEDLL